jgi:type IV fimbrial biogenesis protein FimT
MRAIARHALRRARQHGVTLIETLAVTGIAAVLAAVGIPSLSQFRDSVAVQAQVQSLNSALRRARSEAITHGALVTVCALDPETAGTDAPDCVPTGKDWSAGWLVFIDHGQRGEVGQADKVIKIEAALPNAGSLVGTTRYLTYRASGELLSTAAHFRALPPGQPAVDSALPGSLLICVNKPGKARVAERGVCLG